MLYKFANVFIPMVLAITFHEYAHAYTAYKFGDTTQEKQGRLTLNPIAHIDPVGTLIIPMTLYLMSGVVFGWARPVKTSYDHLLHYNPGNMPSIFRKIALAGPVANFIMTLLWIGIFKLVLLFGTTENPYVAFIGHTAIAGMMINISLAVLNLLPILPLDGGKVLYHSLSEDLQRSYKKSEGWGMIIIFVLAVSSVLNFILNPVINIIMALFSTLFNIEI